MADASASAAPKRQRVFADGDAAQATIDLITAAAKKAEDLAKKCRNVNFTEAGLQEPECELRTLLERLALPEVLQLALAGTGNRSLQTVAMHYAPGTGNDKGGEALLTKLMTITSPPGKDKWDDTENLMAVDLRALDLLETSWHKTLNALLEHVQQLHVQDVRARVYSRGEPDAVPLTNANEWPIALN